MARYKMHGPCPVCGGKLNITSFQCRNCSTVISGRFEPCRFCQLPSEYLSFIEVFLRSRGNIKEVERELGISYPTVRNRLDQVLAAMGYAAGDASFQPSGVRGAESRDDGAGASNEAGAVQAAQGDDASDDEGSATSPDERRRIVEALSRGEISAEEALQRLKHKAR